MLKQSVNVDGDSNFTNVGGSMEIFDDYSRSGPPSAAKVVGSFVDKSEEEREKMDISDPIVQRKRENLEGGITEDRVVRKNKKTGEYTEERVFNLPYASSPFERRKCFECGSDKVETRIMKSPDNKLAHYLCRNCGETKAEKHGWVLFSVEMGIKAGGGLSGFQGTLMPPPGPLQFRNEDTGMPIKLFEKPGGYTDIPQ